MIARAFAIAVIALSGELSAQTLTMFSFPQRGISFGARFLHILPNKGNAPALDGTLDLTADAPIGERINAVASMPLTNDSRAAGGATLIPGNLFVGLQIASDTARRTIITIGAYLPTASTVQSSIPLYVNRYEVQRYAPNHFTTLLNVAGMTEAGTDLRVQGEIGTMYVAATDRADTSTLMLRFGGGAVIGNRDVKFTIGYTGLVNFATSFYGLSNRMLNFVGLGATFFLPHIQPGVMIILPLNNSLLGVVDGSMGLQVACRL